MNRELRPAGWAVYMAIGLAALAIGWSVPLDDFWLTLASGRAIADGADMTKAIPFTFTPVRVGALNPQWGAQVMLGSVPMGVALAITAAASVGALLLTLLRTSRAAGPVAVALAMLVGVVALGPHLVPRVQAFSILLMPLMLVVLERWPSHGATPLVAAVIVAVWANLHGAFVVGMILPPLFLLGRVISLVQAGHALSVFRDRKAWLLAATSIAVMLAPLLNPVGTDLYAYALGQAANPVVRAVSTEWQPAWPWLPIAVPFWALATLLAALRPWRTASPTELVVAAGLGVLAITAVRSIPWFTLAVIPMVARSLETELMRRPTLTRALGSIPPTVLTRPWSRLMTSFVVVLVGFQLVRPALPAAFTRLTGDERVLVNALSEHLPHGESGRVFNEQGWGGYLAYRFDGAVKTYLDGRLEIGTAETWNAYYDIMTGDLDDLRLLHVDWVMVRAEHVELIAALRADGFERIARTEGGVLLGAPAS